MGGGGEGRVGEGRKGSGGGGRAYFNVPAGTFVPGEMKNVLRDLPSVHGPCLMKCRLILTISPSPLARGYRAYFFY